MTDIFIRPQHNAHCNARIEHIFALIYEALNIKLTDDIFADWYAYGDDLI